MPKIFMLNLLLLMDYEPMNGIGYNYLDRIKWRIAKIYFSAKLGVTC